VEGVTRLVDLAFTDASRGWLNGEQCGDGICRGKVLRTDDGGRTWEEVAAAENLIGKVIVADDGSSWLLHQFEQPFGPPRFPARTFLYRLQ
jgi:photosystem II stability/assembly factor-like uncharacterized protein